MIVGRAARPLAAGLLQHRADLGDHALESGYVQLGRDHQQPVPGGCRHQYSAGRKTAPVPV